MRKSGGAGRISVVAAATLIVGMTSVKPIVCRQNSCSSSPSSSSSFKFYFPGKRTIALSSNPSLYILRSRVGVAAAQMATAAIPSLPKQPDDFTSAGIEGTLPIRPWYIGGPVIKGYGRGSKLLGIPTANLSTEGYSAVLSEYPPGVYFGWAQLLTRGIYKMVMSIGWNPYFNNTEKTIEPWLLHEFDDDFYGEELRLAIVGYIRPEANFPSLESLIEKIHEDGKIAENALDLPMYASYKGAPYFTNSL